MGSISIVVNDLASYLKQFSIHMPPSSNFLDFQQDITSKMREILIDWLFEVHCRYRLQSETLYLAIQILDCFLAKVQISRRRLQLVGCTALFIANKYEEIYCCDAMDFIYISDRCFVLDELLAMERLILNTLDFDITKESSWCFAQQHVLRYFQAWPNERFQHSCDYFLQSTLQHVQFLDFPNQLLAFAALCWASFVTQTTFSTHAAQAATLGYSWKEIEHVIQLHHDLTTNENSKYRAVHRKFAAAKYLQVAQLTTTVTVVVESSGCSKRNFATWWMDQSGGATPPASNTIFSSIAKCHDVCLPSTAQA